MEKDDEYENFKEYKMNIQGVENLNEEMLGMLIDNLVQLYIDTYGINFGIDEPEKPDFEVENLDIAKTYLKKFRLQ